MIDGNDRAHCRKCGGFVVLKHVWKWVWEYLCAKCGHGGRYVEEYMKGEQCEHCVYWRKVGETWVPYGSTTVKYSDDYECVLGENPHSCELWTQQTGIPPNYDSRMGLEFR